MSCRHPRWKVRQIAKGLVKTCRDCGYRVLEIGAPKGSFLEDHPIQKALKPKGQRRRL